jgi:Flp pilus assembly protein TadD
LRPHDGALYNNLGVSQSLARQYGQSVQTFMQALYNDGPKERIYNNLGLVLARSGRFAEALDAFMKATDSAKAYNNLGCIYLENGEYRKATQAFEKAIEVSPKFYTQANENLKKIPLKKAIK